jgi:lipopolysaccharide/colanic/teichoic acid biosynthesis glycosyltransferase/DNA-binding MarR family transcriptional regulator
LNRHPGRCLLSKLENQLRILEALEDAPDTTQASLAAQLGVAVGTVNWYLKRLVKKGYVKTKQLERRNLKYFVTPAGLALKARLTTEYMEASLRVYRELRRAAQETLTGVSEAGYESVALESDGEDAGEAMEIFRLTCLERGTTICDDEATVPRIRADGTAFAVTWPNTINQSGQSVKSVVRGSLAPKTAQDDRERIIEAPEPIPTPALKVAFDKAFAVLALLLLAPLFAGVALAMAIDGWLNPENRGPVVYKEPRVSQGRVFSLYKFRVAKMTAIAAATEKKGRKHVKPLEKEEKNKTNVGRWLQKYYLDELPQLINILKGDMSFVGPRPWPVHMVERDIEQGNYQKHVVRPGLTGLVQAHKGELRRFGGGRALDEAYIQACRTLSPVRLLAFDVRLIGQSIRVLTRGEGL